MLEPKHDILSRYLARSQITEGDYQAGRRWQQLHGAATAGDPEAKEMLEACAENLGGRRYELLRDVLAGQDDGLHGPTMLAQAAAKRGLNLKTSSRHMKALGKKFRESLRLLSQRLATPGMGWVALGPLSPIEKAMIKDQLGGVRVSGANDAPIEHVQMIAKAKGFRIVENRHWRFDLFTADNCPTNFQRATLEEIKAALERTPSREKKPALKHKLGPRVGPPVTLAKRA
jgi:hypothetical protein